MPQPPISYTIDLNRIDAMRAERDATFQVLNPLPPIVDQIGGTCGIYALDGALGIRGITHPQPRKEKNIPIQHGGPIPNTSMRQVAKEKGLSKVGEVLDTKKLRELAILCGGADAQVQRINNATDVWNAVKSAVAAKRSIIFPINADSSFDAVLEAPTTTAHWILLIGTYEKGTYRHVLSTQVGRYDLFPLFRLWRSHESLRKFRKSQFDIIELHEKKDKGQIQVWKNLIEKDDPEDENFAATQQKLHKDKPVNYPYFMRKPKVKFEEVDLARTMRNTVLLV